MSKLDGKVAFVTGVARGQGRAEALRLAEDGADIIGVDVCGPVETSVAPPATSSDLEETQRQIKALGRGIVAAEVDVRDFDGLQAALAEGIRQLGRLDIVVANAGVWNYGLAENITNEEWDVVQDVDLKGVWHTAKAAIPILKGQGFGGSIVFTTSALATKGCVHMAPYVAAKAGVIGLMKTMALELAEHNIRVNCVSPTAVDTLLVHNDPTYALFAPDVPAAQRSREAVAPRFAALTQMRVPWVGADDIANAVAFLASDESRYVTGLDLRVDAGACLG